MSAHILIVEDEPPLARNIEKFLAREGFEPIVEMNGEAALKTLERTRPDLVLLDFRLTGITGLEVLNRIRSEDSEIRVILMTAHASVALAVDAMKAGADDFLMKPLSLEALGHTIRRVLGHRRLEKALSYYQQRASSELDDLIGDSPPMQALKADIRRFAEADGKMNGGPPAPVLITGETGTGKELIARAVHFAGPRRAAPLVEINCAALPPNLIEAELFGHERGAFTDAHTSKPGLAEAAEGGTLFLDEIGELQPAVQAKLLRVVEDRRVRRIGAVRDRVVDVRFVAATNRSLEAAVEDGRFRADLYYRLKIVEFAAPPLRQRGDDILQLAEHFLRQLRVRYGKTAMRLSDRAASALVSYSWPGNVRELRNKIEQGVLLSRGDEIGPETIGLSSSGVSSTNLQAVRLPDKGLDFEAWECELLRQALEREHGNVTAAAALLNLSRDTMRYRMDKFGLSRRAAEAVS